MLFIESESPQVGSVKGACGYPPVVLSPLWSRYCRWKPVFWRKCERMESEGLPVMVIATYFTFNSQYMPSLRTDLLLNVLKL